MDFQQFVTWDALILWKIGLSDNKKVGFVTMKLIGTAKNTGTELRTFYDWTSLPKNIGKKWKGKLKEIYLSQYYQEKYLP